VVGFGHWWGLEKVKEERGENRWKTGEGSAKRRWGSACITRDGRVGAGKANR
jgi:hypothetical protein